MKKTALWLSALILSASIAAPLNSVNEKTAVFAEESEEKTESVSLKEAFAGKFKTGAAVSAYEVEHYPELIKSQYNILTPADLMRPWDTLERDNCSYDENGEPVVKVSFSDKLCTVLGFCEENGIALKGNPLVTQAVPQWFFKEDFDPDGEDVSPEEMNRRLEAYIKSYFETLAERYPDLELDSVDVCYEIFSYAGEELRQPDDFFCWTRIYDDDSFAVNAFEYARHYAPEGCRLYLSDFNEYMPEKANNMYSLASKLNERGLIDGIGMESLIMPDEFTGGQDYRAAMDLFLSLGLPVQITELQVDTTHENDMADVLQYGLYNEIFLSCMKNYKNVTAVITAGISDASMDHREYNGLFFDRNYGPKEVLNYIIDMYGYQDNDETPDVPEEPDIIIGDADQNGSVSASDIVAMIQILFGNREVSGNDLKYADLDRDGRVTVADLVKLKNMILNSDDTDDNFVSAAE